MERKKIRRQREGQKFHRKAATTLLARTRKKLIGKTSWFKNKKHDKEEEVERRKETKERKRWETQEAKIGNPTHATKVTNREPKAVIFVPCTENGGLVRALREGEAQMEEITDVRLKFEEKAGSQLSRMICKTDPWAGKDCER